MSPPDRLADADARDTSPPQVVESSDGQVFGASRTTLADGTILIIGGKVIDDTEREARPQREVWRIVEGRRVAGAALAVPRSNHTATLLADGRVLVTGGEEEEAAEDPGTTYQCRSR